MRDNATWDDNTTEVFLHALLGQIYAHERRGLSFSKTGWKAIVAEFNDRTNRGYTRKQLKNKFDMLRKDFRTWKSLLSETGAGFNPETRTIDASDGWWDVKIQGNKGYSKFRKAPLKFETELNIIFRDIYASGDIQYYAAFEETQDTGAGAGAGTGAGADDADDDDDDVYIPVMDEREGSGDSEDDSFGAQPPPSTGATEELAGIGISSQSGPSATTGSGSLGKRKRVIPSQARKRSRVPVADRLADAVSVMADCTKQRSVVMTDIQERSVATVIRDLCTLDAVKTDPPFRIRCVQMLSQDKRSRDAFVGLWKENQEYLIEWLRFAVDCYFGQ